MPSFITLTDYPIAELFLNGLIVIAQMLFHPIPLTMCLLIVLCASPCVITKQCIIDVEKEHEE
jgi:hypothetical protein